MLCASTFWIARLTAAGSSYARTSFWHCRGAPRKDMESSQFVQARLGTFHVFSHRCPRKKAVAGFPATARSLNIY